MMSVKEILSQNLIFPRIRTLSHNARETSMRVRNILILCYTLKLPFHFLFLINYANRVYLLSLSTR